jgi:hypothetical protein
MTGLRRSALRGLLLVPIVVLGSALLLAGPAAAQDDDGDADQQIVLWGELIVPAGETVEYAGIVNGPATIDGTVEESLLVVNGDVEISGTVRGDVVVIVGSVLVRSGAEIGGDLASRETPTIEDGATVGGEVRELSTRFDVDLGLTGHIVWWVAYSGSTLFLGLLLLLLVPRLDDASVVAMRDRLGAVIGFGVAAFFLLPVVAGLLLVTIVGIPAGLFLLLALAFVYTIGYVVGMHALGRLVVKPPTSRFGAFLAGWAALRLVAFVPIVGGVVWLLVAIAGLGVVFVAARRRPVAPLPPGVVPPPPEPATV